MRIPILTHRALALCALSSSLFGQAAFPAHAPQPPAPARMPSLIENFTADEQSLERAYPLRLSRAHTARFERFYKEELGALQTIDFPALSQEDKVDYLLLKHELVANLHRMAIERQQRDQMHPLLPFAATVEAILEQQRRMQRPDAEQAAQLLNGMTRQLEQLRRQLDPANAGRLEKPSGPASGLPSGPAKIDPVVANRAVLATRELKVALAHWFRQYDGYDPNFTWWVALPYKNANQALEDYSGFLKEKLIGIEPNDTTTIIGDPVGRQALLNGLSDDLIPYTPEELIAIAQTEYDWCMKEMLKASRELGYGEDWHAAVEKVKQLHVAPGEQPELIRKLVVEGSDFVKQHDLVTVPPLADETWTMIMMTPERQLVNPFFTGGDEISVSYPTDTMTYDQREMSMRGNNIAFAHATAFHEMIPGHFLQFYMNQRYRPYRERFDNAFWGEGNAFWWEMLFYDRGFDKTPEERIGALVWRMHRSARVIFTMNFHLGKWTPQQCVQYLVENVGFDSENDLAEVRRSFDGSVGPLYQIGYLMGALQFRQLHHELVDAHRMTDRQFHDAILHEGPMPLELLRADLEDGSLTPDFATSWKFYGEHPTHP